MVWKEVVTSDEPTDDGQRTAQLGQRATHVSQQVTDFGQPTTDDVQRTTDDDQRKIDDGQRISVAPRPVDDVADEPILLRVGVSGRARRTWPQRILILVGLVVSAVFFGAGYVFWQANVVLGEVPRISVGSNVLAQEGDPGEPVNFLLVGVDSSEGLDPDDPVRVGRCLLYTSPSPRDQRGSRMPSSA